MGAAQIMGRKLLTEAVLCVQTPLEALHWVQYVEMQLSCQLAPVKTQKGPCCTAQVADEHCIDDTDGVSGGTWAHDRLTCECSLNNSPIARADKPPVSALLPEGNCPPHTIVSEGSWTSS